ncbi:MAG TPA: peptide chain release factor 2 [Candidatus Saccharimonadales bacterium]|nr:peptide chain release factor 2 [Candidatus Saccharimonadales bacterium]
MYELELSARQLQKEVTDALQRLGFDGLMAQKQQLDSQINDPGFWNEPKTAQEIVRKRAKLEHRLQPWEQLRKTVSDIAELADMRDPAIQTDLSEQLSEAEQTFTSLKNQLKLAGPYDDYDVILSVYAGAGGTDAQDWAQMLLRMYVRWAEKQGYSVKTIDESAGDEAGIKSATLEIEGNFAYGKLKGEHGVHRLVRLSPFNADNLRQTSFAKVDVLPKVDRPEALIIDDKDLRIDVYRAGGHGGQSVNTTDSAVRVTHIPTGITAAIQNERSQLQNKEVALTIVRSRLIQLQMEQHKEKLEELKGPNQSAEWGNQIRSYVLHPYKQVKDLRTRYETSDTDGVIDGNIDAFIEAYLLQTLGSTN